MGTIVNWALLSLHGGSPESTLTVRVMVSTKQQVLLRVFARNFASFSINTKQGLHEIAYSFEKKICTKLRMNS